MANYGVPFERVKARFLNPDSETARIADVIFDFKSNDMIKEKYIYFDNAFAKDGINTNDNEILRTVSEIVGTIFRGKYTIFIKKCWRIKFL